MAQFAVISDLRKIVVADQVLRAVWFPRVLPQGVPTSVTCESGELLVRASEQASLGLHELVLHVPKAADTKIHVYKVLIAGCSGSRRNWRLHQGSCSSHTLKECYAP
jgi:hypothetical protein